MRVPQLKLGTATLSRFADATGGGEAVEPALGAALRRIGDLLGLLPGADLAVDVERAVRAGLASARLRAAPVLWQYRLRERPGAAWGPWLAVPANELDEWRDQLSEMTGAAKLRPLMVGAWPAESLARAHAMRVETP